MSVSSFYTLEMKVNGVDFPEPLTTCNFAIQQSIFNLYPKLVITYQDTMGLLNESYSMEVGSKIEIRLLVGDSPIFRSLFYVYKSGTDQISDMKTITGMYTVHCIHVMAWRQQNKSRAFRDRISNIVKAIGSEYGYQTDVNDTGNADVWYQCNITDGQFLMTQLLPNAWSHNAEGSPFYCYVDLQNVLHLRHLKSFVKNNPKYGIYMSSNSDRIVMPDKTVIKKGAPILFTYTRELVDIYEYAKSHLIDTWEINRDNGNVNRKKVDCFNQPKSSTGNILYMNPNKGSINLIGTGFTNTEVGREENTKGQVIQTSRLFPGIEKITLIILFHTDTYVNLGDRISLIFTKLDLGEGKYSGKMSDAYVVTESDLMWDQKKAVMYQRLVLTRNAVQIPTGLKNYSKFLKLEQKTDSTIQGN